MADVGTMNSLGESFNGDLLVVGGGLVGLTFARAASNAGLKVMLVDRQAPEHVEGEYFDGRVSSIAKGSANMLRHLGIWKLVQAEAQPIQEIRVTDRESPFFLHYNAKDVGAGPMGYIIENRVLRLALNRIVAADPKICWETEVEVQSIERNSHRVSAELSNGIKVSAMLVVAADGKNSALRSGAGIKIIERAYHQTGIVCSVRHSFPHNAIAHERFLSAVPFAILPMIGNCSSLVWTERPDTAAAILNLGDTDFVEELSWRFGGFLGELEVISPRWHYPLQLLLARELISERLALVGDAAHAIHPIAGQGLNLGLRDAAALAQLLGEAQRLGMDLGDPIVLSRYDQWRRFDGFSMAAITDGLNRLFSTTLVPVRGLRTFGLGAVNQLPFLKRIFQRHAMGTLGGLPNLFRDNVV